MKYGALVSAILVLFLSMSVFAWTSPSWNLTGLDLNGTSAKSLAGFRATINYTGDLNGVCFNTSDSNSGGLFSCYETSQAAGTFIDLNTSIINIASDGSYTLYAFLRGHDLNYSFSSNETILIDGTAPSLGGTYPASAGDYNSATITFDINIVDLSATTVAIKLDGNAQSPTCSSPTATIKECTFTAGAMSDGTHTVAIDANDALLNGNLSASYTFLVDTAAPTSPAITSSYSASYTNDEEPDFALSATDSASGMAAGKAALSCKSTGTYQEFAYSAAISTFNITASTYDCNTADGNKAVYVKFRDEAGNWTAPVMANVLYDNTAPSAPSNLTATAGNAQVSLSWTAPSADNLSGNAGYKVYKGGTLYSSTTSTTAAITGLANGTAYSFTVSAYDNAGNEGSQSAAASATPTSGSVSVYAKKNNMDADYAKGGDVLSIECSFSSEVDAAKIKYKYYNPTQDAQTLKGPTDNVSSLSENITVSSTNYERLGVWCEGTLSQTISSSEKSIILDNNAPAVAWQDTNTVYRGSVRIYVNATDDKLLEKVEFLFNNVYYGATKETGANRYYFDFNTGVFDNGGYALKAIGTDRAGNKRTIERNITLDNILSAKQKAQKAIAEAKTKQQSASDLMNYFKAQGLVFGAELTAKKEQADGLLAEAQSLLESNAASAQGKAESAAALYAEVNAAASVETIETKTYEYGADSVADKLRAAGLGEEYVLQAAQAIADGRVERKLNIVKVGGNSYQASVIITLTNGTSEGQFKVVEVIPKSLAISARSIYSASEFAVINEDPIIEFTVAAAPGTKATISYGVGTITQAQADALTANNVIAAFSAPPVILPAATQTKQAFSSVFNGAIMMMTVGIIVVVVAAAIIMFVVIRAKAGRPGFGGGSFLDSLDRKKDSVAGKKWQFKKK